MVEEVVAEAMRPTPMVACVQQQQDDDAVCSVANEERTDCWVNAHNEPRKTDGTRLVHFGRTLVYRSKQRRVAQHRVQPQTSDEPIVEVVFQSNREHCYFGYCPTQSEEASAGSFDSFLQFGKHSNCVNLHCCHCLFVHDFFLTFEQSPANDSTIS
jgi:hypothetical protein